MRMNEVKSVTWSKMAEIPTDDFSIAGIGRAINEEFGVGFFDDIFAVMNAIVAGYIEIADDGIIVWGSWKEV